MRIIERVNPLNQSVIFVVQDASWNGATAYQNSLSPRKIFGKAYEDIASFSSLEDARVFAHRYENNLNVGERIVG